MLGVLRQNPLSPPLFRSDPNPPHLRSSPDQTPFPIRTSFNLSSPISASTPLASTPSTASLPEASPDNSQLVLSLLQSYGFSDEQTDVAVSKNPRLLSAHHKKTIKCKLDYLLSFGYTTNELIGLVLSDPQLLSVSLEKRLNQNHNLLLNLFGSKELIKKAVLRQPWLLGLNFDKYVLPNLETLRANGVPTRRILQTFMVMPRAITHKPAVIVSLVKELRKLGIDPASRAFIVAIEAKVRNQWLWDRKVELYKSFGWSDADFIAAFAKHPHCMLNSEGKIKKMMEFYVNKLGWDPLFLCQQPFYVGLSLEKRVIPRCAVLEILASRGLLDGEQELHWIFVLHQSLFEAKFVSSYKESIPAVLEAYQARQEDDFDDFAALRSWQKITKQTTTMARKASIPASSSK